MNKIVKIRFYANGAGEKIYENGDNKTFNWATLTMACVIPQTTPDAEINEIEFDFPHNEGESRLATFNYDKGFTFK